MRVITLLGFALFATGAIVLVTSSGAFDATTADRGIGVETAADENALLGVERFGTETDPILLVNGNNCGLFNLCYEYDSESIIKFYDNPGDYVIEVDEVTLEDIGGNDESPSLTDWEVTNENGDVIVEADLECNRNDMIFGGGAQNGGQGELTVSAVMGESEDITVELDRSVTVECEDE